MSLTPLKPFAYAHATHPDAHMALALAAAQIEAQRAQTGLQPSLGWIYLTEAFCGAAEGLLAELRQRWPGVAWLGASGPGICAGGTEYFAEPALALMLAELPREQFQLFSGVQPLGDWQPELLQVHADPRTPDLQELIAELAGHSRSGYAFGGLAAGRGDAVQIADGVWRGGLSGAGFGARLQLVSRVSQGCQALGPERRIDACDGGLVTLLDGQPALDCLLQDLALPVTTGGAGLRDALPRMRRTLAGIGHDDHQQDKRHARGAGAYGPQVRVRHLVGIDPARRGVVVAQSLQPGQRLSFCERSPEAARRDLLRICTELRALAEDREGGPARIAGAIYISCSGRGGPHFGAPNAEAQWVQHALGDVPMVGFFAGGEIAHASLHGYTGVLSVFLS